MRLRHYGFHSAPARAKLQRVREILQSPAPAKPLPAATPKPQCPCCGKDMALHRELPRPPFALRTLMQAAARPAPVAPDSG